MAAKKRTEVVITNVEIPFWRLVGIMMKWMIAAIPATALLSFLILLVHFLFTALLGGVMVMGGSA